MKNSVHLTLARYHDLMDIERNFDNKVIEKSEEKVQYSRDLNENMRNYYKSQQDELEETQTLLSKWKKGTVVLTTVLVEIIIAMVIYYSLS